MKPATIRRVPNTPGTPRRTVRIDDELWRAVAEKASAEGRDASSVIRDALTRYLATPAHSEAAR